MAAKKKFVSPRKFALAEPALRREIRAALDRELALCAHPDLVTDKHSGDLWSSLPTVDSKTAHKISASVVEQILDCVFEPAWIQRGGYSTTEEATNHVLHQLRTNCVRADEAVPA